MPVPQSCIRIMCLSVLLVALNAPAQNSHRAVPPTKTTHASGESKQVVNPHPKTFAYKSPIMRKLWDSTAAGHQRSRALVAGPTDPTVSPFLTNPPMYPVGADPHGVALGDFNADGKPDIIVAANPPVLFLGNGDGTFQSPTSIGTIASGPTAVAVGDFNHDGALDVVFATPGSAVLYLGNGNGSFAAGVTISSGGANQNVPAFVVAADVNNDGSADLILNTDGGISVLLGNGNGTFQSPKTSPGAFQFMAAADFNKDGRLDLAVTDGFGSLSILLGNGTGTFTQSSVYSTPISQSANALAIADFNQDGFPDVALPSGQIFIGKGDGTLKAPTNFQTATNANVVYPVDLDGDGITDLVTGLLGEDCGGADFGTTGVSLGNGDGTFRSVRVFDAGGCVAMSLITAGLVAGDLNGDGAADLVVISGQQSLMVSGAQLSVLINRGAGTFPAAEMNIAGGTGTVAVADLDSDGNPDIVLSDGSVYLGNGDGSLRFLPGAPIAGVAVAIGDFNHDGNPDVAFAAECAPAGCTSGGQLLIALGNGDGTLKPARALASRGFYAEALAIGDFNGDGSPDIALLNNCTDINCSAGGSLSIFFANGNGTFHFANTVNLSLPQSSSATPVSVVAGDFNNDGILDLAAVEAVPGFLQPSVVNVMLGNGDGSFQAPAVFVTSTSGSAFSATAADFNQDGILDLALADGFTCSDCNAHGAILYGNGDGTFVEGPRISTQGGPPVSVVAADFYGTGILTAVLANHCGDFLDCPGGSVMIDGTQNQTDIMLLFLGVGDFNNDGKPDLAGSLQYDSGASVLLNIGATASATTLTVSPFASQSYAAFQPATFTAQVHHTGPGTPTHAVKFFDNGVLLGSSPVDSNGNAAFTTSTLSVGSHFIVPHYSGDASFAGSNALGVRVTVALAATTTTLSSSANPSYLNQPVTFTANVTSQYSGTMTGSVTFNQGKTVIATVPLSNGQASFTTTYTATGVRQITATYSGDNNDLGSTSAIVRQVINTLPAATTTAIATSGSPSVINQPVTFTATITSTYGPIPDGEVVTFFDGASPIATAATSAGVASFTTASLTAKLHTIKANYPGDATFKPSSAHLQQSVTLYSSTVALISTPNPSTIGQSVTLTATVNSTGPSPTGTVIFRNGTQSLGSGTLSGGVASVTTSRLPPGTDSITAVYNGDSKTTKSTSIVISQAVD